MNKLTFIAAFLASSFIGGANAATTSASVILLEVLFPVLVQLLQGQIVAHLISEEFVRPLFMWERIWSIKKSFLLLIVTLQQLQLLR